MKKYYILIFALLALFSACERNVLDKGPLNTVDEELVWTDPSVAQLYVNDLYAGLSFYNIWDNLDNTTDLIETGHTWMGSYQYYAGLVTADQDNYSRWYYYSNIRKLNVLLDNAEKLGDSELAKTVTGEAIFLRAYYYFHLVRAYGGVPLIKHAQNITDDLSVARNSYEECVTFICDELDKAAELLPPSWDDVNIGRATSGAALALKSILLLHAASPLNNPTNDLSKWQAAADAAKTVIDLGVYALYPDYANLFFDNNNEEVIFDIQWGYPYRYHEGEEIISQNFIIEPQNAITPGEWGPWGANRPTQEYVDMFEMANGKAITDPESGYDPQNPYEGRDPRFYASIFYNGTEWRGNVIETFFGGRSGPGEWDIYDTGANMTGYYCRKFADPNVPCVYMIDEVKANWIMIRYAEILLNYAETQIALGNEEEARTYINMVRDRAGMPPAEATGDDLVKLYRNERVVELGMEEQRHFDVRRWKIAEEVLGRTLHKMSITRNDDGTFSYEVEELSERVFPTRMYWQPIPIDEIRKNKNLEQNPGY